MVSFLEMMRQEQAKIISPNDPWRVRLERVRGRVGDDGIEARIAERQQVDTATRDRCTGFGDGATARRLGPLEADRPQVGASGLQQSEQSPQPLTAALSPL